MICKNCGEEFSGTGDICAHCTAEYYKENNERYDSLKPLDEESLDRDARQLVPLDIEAFDRACQKWKEIKESDNVFNRGV